MAEGVYVPVPGTLLLDASSGGAGRRARDQGTSGLGSDPSMLDTDEWTRTTATGHFHTGGATRTLISLSVILLVGLASAARGDTITFALPYLGPPGIVPNAGQTFTGNGFVTALDAGFVDAFSMDNGHSYFQQDISALAGTNVTEARLEFNISGGAVSQPVTVTSFESGGVLAHHFSPPNVLSSQVFTVNGSGPGLAANSLDVTALLDQRVDGGTRSWPCTSPR
jgi:hypothetical protein